MYQTTYIWLTALILLLTVSSSTSFGEIIWVGQGGDMNWFTADNWDTLGSPAGQDVKFGTDDRVAVGVINNIIDADITIASLAYTNSTREAYTDNKYAHTTEIASGITLTIDGSSSPVNAMLVGGRELTSQYRTEVKMTGGGNLVIDAENSNFYASNPSSNHRGDVYFDISGLNYFHASVSNFYLSLGGRALTYFTMPSVNDETNRISANMFVAGDGSSATDGQCYVYLGRHTELYADDMFVGARSDPTVNYQATSGFVTFQDIPGVTPTVKIRAKDGTSRANLTIAQLGSYSNNQLPNRRISAYMDFRGGIVDALFDHIQIAQHQGYDRSRSIGSFSMGAGVVDTTSITLGRIIYRSSGSAYPAYGTLNVTGGLFRAGSILLGENASGDGKPYGIINLSGSGIIEVNGDVTMGIRNGGTTDINATINVSNGTMTVTGNIMPADVSEYITSNLNIAGGNLVVTNSLGDSTFRIDHGTLGLIKGTAIFDNLDLNGAYATTTTVEVAGKDLEDFAQVTVNNSLELGGSLVVTATDGYTPKIGDSWTVISGSGTRTGEFVSTVLLEGMNIEYTADGFTLSIVGQGTLFLIQ